jgi:hypothetical protein
MAIGASIAGAGMLLCTLVQPGGSYAGPILPASLIVFGLGLGLLVAPLTAEVREAAPRKLKGIASAFNNAVARLAGLLAVALLPLAAGIAGSGSIGGATLARGFAHAMVISAGLCFGGAAVAFFTMDSKRN